MTGKPDHYGRVAVGLHWAIAALIALALASGFAAENIADGRAALRVHVVAGALAGLLTLARVAWWWFADTRPAPNTQGLTDTLAKLVHILLIVVPLGMAASGVGMMVLSGAGAQLIAGDPSALPEFERLPPRMPHGLGARLLVALIVGHVAAALYHHMLLGDGLLRRMWPKRG